MLEKDEGAKPAGAVTSGEKRSLRVADIVHYREADGSPTGILRAAIVTMDYGGKEIGLAVMPPNRTTFIALKRTSEGTGPGQWSWPPRV